MLIHEKRYLRWKIKVDVVIFEHKPAGNEDGGVGLRVMIDTELP